ncbi:MAG TPA: hypothetical protein VH063_13230 [Gaiellaceae bacterium]|jgi:hypothetical protein|nr:hypothetical protein [Gaiellaceae bacterium]
MRERRLERLQWFGLLAGGLAWAFHLVFGYFFAEGHCEVSSWRSDWSQAVVALTVAAALVAILAAAASATVFLALRRVSTDSAGPPGRRHLFAIGGMVANVLFLVAILLSGITVVATNGCRPA